MFNLVKNQQQHTIHCIVEEPAASNQSGPEATLKSYSYQWLSADGASLECPAFLPVHLLAGRNNYSDFIHQVISKYPNRQIKRMFLKQGASQIEIQNATDFQVLTGLNSSPQLILSQSENASFIMQSPLSAFPRSDYTFTIRGPSFNVLEVYISNISLLELKKAITAEFRLTSQQQSSLILKKSTTGALLYKDTNLLHLSSTDIIDVSWEL